jgi:hypothetical protein
MLNHMLRNFGFRRRPSHRARNASGGALIPILGFLAYRYREPIGRFLREKLQGLQQRRSPVSPTGQGFATQTQR